MHFETICILSHGPFICHNGNSEIFNRAKGRNQPKSSATKTFNIRSTVLVFGQRSPVFGLLINHEEEAARKTQEEKLQEWRYNKRTAEMIAKYERDQEKEAKKSRPERDKCKKPVNKEATRSYLGSRSNGVKPSSPKKAVQKPQSKPVVETPSASIEEKRNYGFERWLTSFKAKIHQKADLGKDLTTAYASGYILGSFSCDKLVQPFVCKEYDPVKLLRHDEGLQHFIFEPGEETRDQSNNNQSMAKKTAKVEQKNVGSFILEGPDLRTNPFKGGGDDATQISSYVPTRILRYEPSKQLIIVWFNGHFMGLIGLIHEVLDRDKLMGLMQNVEALCSIRNQCLDLSNKGPPRKYKSWSYSISI
ncbi:hypothetical protein YC2023_010783 [Brassica napus]